jgi:mono/diheme cytochrome c family protein
MNRSRRSPWFLPSRKGPSPWAVCVLLLPVLAGCGGDRRSGAVPGTDSSPASAADNSAAGLSDTAAVAAPDTAKAGARPDTTATRPDTATQVAKAPPKKPTPRPVPPKPAPPKTQPTETTTAAAPQAAETTAAAPAQTSAPLRDEYHLAPVDTVSQEVYSGWKQFNLNCARCHGEDVQGTTIAPHLIVSLRPDGPINTKEIFVQTVCAGRPEKGMPAWCALGLDMDKINQIYAYVKGRSDSKIHPGRPAVKSGG